MSRTRRDFVDYFQQRFGVDPPVWAPYRLRFSAQSVHLVGRGVPESVDLQMEMTGFRAARLTSHSFKPTTRLIQWLGPRIRAHRIELPPCSLERMLDRQAVEGEDLRTRTVTARGYVALFYGGCPVGCGFWTGERLETQLPKSLTRQFPREVLEDL